MKMLWQRDYWLSGGLSGGLSAGLSGGRSGDTR